MVCISDWVNYMTTYSYMAGTQTYQFANLKTVLAKATPARSGDHLAGVAADTYAERMAARMCLAQIPLKTFLEDLIVPYESDEVTRLIVDSCISTRSANARKLSGRKWLTPCTKNPSCCRTISEATFKMVLAR